MFVWVMNDILSIYVCLFFGLVSRMLTSGPGHLGSIPCHVIQKTFKMVLDTSLLNTQEYKIRIKGKVEHSRERSSALPYTSVQHLSKREPSGCHGLRSPSLLIFNTESFNDLSAFLLFILYMILVLLGVIFRFSADVNVSELLLRVVVIRCFMALVL